MCISDEKIPSKRSFALGFLKWPSNWLLRGPQAILRGVFRFLFTSHLKLAYTFFISFFYFPLKFFFLWTHRNRGEGFWVKMVYYFCNHLTHHGKKKVIKCNSFPFQGTYFYLLCPQYSALILSFMNCILSKHHQHYCKNLRFIFQYGQCSLSQTGGSSFLPAGCLVSQGIGGEQFL